MQLNSPYSDIFVIIIIKTKKFHHHRKNNHQELEMANKNQIVPKTEQISNTLLKSSRQNGKVGLIPTRDRRGVLYTTLPFLDKNKLKLF